MYSNSSTAYKKVLNDADITEHAIQMIESTDREAVNMMLHGINKSIDVIVPRGGKNLVAQVEKEAKVPVFAHLRRYLSHLCRQRCR